VAALSLRSLTVDRRGIPCATLGDKRRQRPLS
jgi:hypothetical protein